MNRVIGKLRNMPVVAAMCCAAGLILITSLYLSYVSWQTELMYREIALQSEQMIPKRKPLFKFPAGGRELSGKYRMVALYGVTDSPALGLLGEQPLNESVARAKGLAAQYQPYSREPVYPAFEIIATVAAADATEDGDYSRESDPNALRPWVEVAKRSGVYVLLDLQPGREDFLSQAKLYESLLQEPNVGLALDPEWRLAPNQVHLEQIGSVGIDEVNATGQWLSRLTTQKKLPQKLLLLHQFRADMIAGRERLQMHPNLATVVQMDGQGDQPGKLDTWNTLINLPPANVAYGWKNFIDEDRPTLSPAETMQRQPQPWYVSYQ